MRRNSFWMAIGKIAGLSLIALRMSTSALGGEKIAYSPRNLDGPAVAVVCVHVRMNKNPLKFGHSALTIFKLDPTGAKGKTLVSKSAEWTGYWISRTKDEGYWEGKDFEKNPENSQNTYFPFNGGINHYRAFETQGSNRDSERICVPATAAELAKVRALVESRRDKKYNLWHNCNDFTTEALALLTNGEIKFDARVPWKLNMSMPGKLLSLIQAYHQAHPPGKDEVLDYKPNSVYEREMLATYDQMEMELVKNPSLSANCVVKKSFKNLP